VDGIPLKRVIQRAQHAGLGALPIPAATFIAVELLKHAREPRGGFTEDEVGVDFEGFVDVDKPAASVVTDHARRDVSSVGLLYYRMLTGEGPVAGELISPKVINPSIPNVLVQTVLTATGESPYESAGAMLQPLSRWLAENAPGYAKESLRDLMAELFPDERPALGRAGPEAHTTQLRKPVMPSSRPPLALGFVALVVIGVVVAALAMRVASSRRTVQSCLDIRVEGERPADLKQVQKGIGACLERPLSAEEVWALEQYVCGVQRLAIAGAFELAHAGQLDQAEQRLSFLPVTCAAAELSQAKVWFAQARKVAPGGPLPADPMGSPVTARRPEVERAIAAARADLMLNSRDGDESAKGELEKCVQVDPTSPDCHRLLGSAFSGLADLKRSTQEYQLFLKYASATDPAVGPVKLMLEAMQKMATP
jgi:hypothetical protein